LLTVTVDGHLVGNVRPECRDEADMSNVTLRYVTDVGRRFA
jgi:hypothetical protein